MAQEEEEGSQEEEKEDVGLGVWEKGEGSEATGLLKRRSQARKAVGSPTSIPTPEALWEQRCVFIQKHGGSLPGSIAGVVDGVARATGFRAGPGPTVICAQGRVTKGGLSRGSSLGDSHFGTRTAPAKRASSPSDGRKENSSCVPGKGPQEGLWGRQEGWGRTPFLLLAPWAAEREP